MTASSSRVQQSVLQLGAARVRRDAILKERARLLRQIEKKKAELEAAQTAAQHAAGEVLRRAGPLLEKCEAIRAEIGALFDAILADERLSKRARKQIVRVRRLLEEQGSIDPPRECRAPAGEAFEGEEDDFVAWEDEAPARNGQEFVASADARGHGKQHESLRSLFRRLALEVHPDRAAHEEDRERRTERMKELTRAFDAGDLARLLDLERLWSAGDQRSAPDDDEDGQLARIEAANRELRSQLKALQRDLRQLRRASPQAAFMGLPIDAVLEVGEADVTQLEAVRDFVASFRDGKVSLKDFVNGPQIPVAEELGDAGADIAAVLDEMLAELTASPSRGRRQRR